MTAETPVKLYDCRDAFADTLVELAHDEFDRVPQVLDQFSNELDELGPNPLKGF